MKAYYCTHPGMVPASERDRLKDQLTREQGLTKWTADALANAQAEIARLKDQLAEADAKVAAMQTMALETGHYIVSGGPLYFDVAAERDEAVANGLRLAKELESTHQAWKHNDETRDRIRESDEAELKRLAEENERLVEDKFAAEHEVERLRSDAQGANIILKRTVEEVERLREQGGLLTEQVIHMDNEVERLRALIEQHHSLGRPCVTCEGNE